MKQEEMFPKNAFELVQFNKAFAINDSSRIESIKAIVIEIIKSSEAEGFMMDAVFLNLVIDFFRDESELWNHRSFCIKVAQKLNPLFPFECNYEIEDFENLNYLLNIFVAALYENSVNIIPSTKILVELGEYYALNPHGNNFDKLLRSYCLLYAYDSDIKLHSLRSCLSLEIDKLESRTALFMCLLLNSTHDGEGENWDSASISIKSEKYIKLLIFSFLTKFFHFIFSLLFFHFKFSLYFFTSNFQFIAVENSSFQMRNRAHVLTCSLFFF